MKIGFDNEKYLALQAEHIRQRMSQFGGKLYLEFGGKLFDDYHASRVLPGFQPDSKIRMLETIRDDVEIVIAICAGDIEKNKTRGDLGIGYDQDVLRLIDVFRGLGFYVGSVVITQYAGQPAADVFRNRLNALGIPAKLHYPIDGAGGPQLPPLSHRRVSFGRGPHRLRRGSGQKRLHRDQPLHRGGDGPRPRQRQDGHLPEPAVPRP